jgi:ribonuclease VapC
VIVLETSALVALVLKETEAERIARVLASGEPVLISAVSRYEALVVLNRKKPPFDPAMAVDDTLTLCGANVIAFDASQSTLAFEAYTRFGKGSGSPAKLNLADCAAYALAKQTGAPLLFTGGDFAHTDLTAA